MPDTAELTRQPAPDASLTGNLTLPLSQDRLAAVVLGVLAAVSVVVAFVTTTSYDTGDSLMHYLFAQWAWVHPRNLLDLWAKPLFTLLAAGPAYFGFRGMMLFQCGVVAWSAWLAYTSARRLRLPAPVLAMVFCYAAPDYFRIQFSGLTEPLFGLVLVGAVSLALHGRYRWSAAVLSWLPLVRSEGIALLGLWALLLLLERQWKALPWLALGLSVYSVVGAPFYGNNLAWLFTNNPYPLHSSYGSGEWYHYLIHFPSMLGWPLTLLFSAGVLATLWRMRQAAAWRRVEFRVEILLLDGSIVLFMLLQSVFWAYGLFGSYGMLRIMTVLTPLLAVVALGGLAALSRLAARPAARRWVLAGGTLFVVGLLFSRDYLLKAPNWEDVGLRGNLHWRRDFRAENTTLAAEEAAGWLKQHDPRWAWRPVAYEQLNFGMALHLDPFDHETRVPLSINGQSNYDNLPVGTYLYWDEFWAGGQGQVPFDRISNDPRYRKLWESLAPPVDHELRQRRYGVLYERVQ